MARSRDGLRDVPSAVRKVGIMRRIVIIGATSLIAQHVLRQWLGTTGAEVHLVGRDADRLEAVARDLAVRSPESTLEAHAVDVLDLDAVETLAAELTAQPLDLVLIAHGTLPSQSECQSDRSLAARTMLVNGNSVALCAEAFVARMDHARAASVVVIGSVAGDRGRRTNYVYGAAKALVATYVEGLQHRLAGRPLRVVLVKPGPTATPMTSGLGMPRLARPEDVAREIVRGVERGAAVIYAPRAWQVIMLVIRHLPRIVFDRLSI